MVNHLTKWPATNHLIRNANHLVNICPPYATCPEPAHDTVWNVQITINSCDASMLYDEKCISVSADLVYVSALGYWRVILGSYPYYTFIDLQFLDASVKYDAYKRFSVAYYYFDGIGNHGCFGEYMNYGLFVDGNTIACTSNTDAWNVAGSSTVCDADIAVTLV